MLDVAITLLGLGVGIGLSMTIAGLVPTERAAFKPVTGLRGRWKRKSARDQARTAGAPLVGAVTWVLSGWPVAGVAAAALVFVAPWLFSTAGTAAARIQRLEAIEDWLRRLADLVGPGYTGLVSALRDSVRHAPDPIARELTSFARRLRTWDVQEALLELADDLDDQVGDAVVAGLCVAYHQGAGTTDLLRALAQQVADDVSARRTAEADRARRRSAARTLLVIWALMFAGFAFFASPTYTSAYRTLAGQLVLAIVLGVVALAMIWLRRLGAEPAAPRFLNGVGA